MKTALKIAGICFLTIFILCLNVNGRPMFEPVYSALSHVTIPFQNATGSLFASMFSSTQDYSRKLFNNSVPKVKDAVKARASGPMRSSGEPHETILVEEKEELDELIKSHH
ncbi:MAG: hypothetical protein ACJ76H_16445 [Bacteriovoracaceae bacterium]